MKTRTTGQILLAMEPLLQQLASQGLQMGDILWLIYGYYKTHDPTVMEEYEDGTEPILFYGHKENL